jgi:hypothetical protein
LIDVLQIYMLFGTRCYLRFDLIHQKRIRTDFQSSNEAYVRFLVQSIGTRWRAEVPEWVTCDTLKPFVIQEQSIDSIVTVPNWPICPESTFH